MIIDTQIKVKWTNTNRKHYESLGYIYTGNNCEFDIFVTELPHGSNVKINVSCDECGSMKSIFYSNYLRSTKRNGEYYCKACSSRRVRNEEAILRIKNGEAISFKEWCLKNDRYDILERWDYKLNHCLPEHIPFATKHKYFFVCPRNLHDSELKSIISITNSIVSNVSCYKCNSFAQYLLDEYGEDGITNFWGEGNSLSPWNISAGTDKIKVFIKCQMKDYHNEYEILPSSFHSGSRCPFCRGIKTHPIDSFAQFHKNKHGDNFLELYWDYKNNNIDPYYISPYANKSVYIFCQNTKYHGSYLIDVAHFTNGDGCPYCSRHRVHKLDSIGTTHPLCVDIWSDYNKATPYNYSFGSSKKVWWKCESGKHEDYKRSICSSIKSQFRCPECVRERNQSFLQEKVQRYINDRYCYYTLKHERNCSIVPQHPKLKGSQGHMPFDNEIVDIKLIIEVHGAQHYSSAPYGSIWGGKSTLTPEQQLKKRKLYDRYKKYVAYVNGYHYLAIPYWREDNDSYKKLIDTKINEILILSVKHKEVV